MAHYAAMIEQLLQQPQLRVVLVGSAEQEPALAALQARCAASGRVISLAGRTDWSTLAAVLRRARLVICNNSGIAHLAASLGVPTLAIYSASHQMREWGPRGLLSRAIMADMPCSPCGLEAVAACPYGHSCMTRITPEMVAAQALDMLAFDAAEMAVPPVPAWQNG
jgi:ADP-heptose:LPS heptosyltransferase